MHTNNEARVGLSPALASQFAYMRIDVGGQSATLPISSKGMASAMVTL